MNRLISDILGAPEPQFSHSIQMWEVKSGRKSHDLRLLSEVAARRREALRSLKLDTEDTTPKELFYTLRHKAGEANGRLEKVLGVSESDNPEVLLEKVVAFVESMDLNRDVWTIKHSYVKSILKKQPPKKLMKCLGLRSIDSVLKRTNSCELLSLANHIETPEWNRKIQTNFKKLKPTDFQAGKSCIFIVNTSKVEKLRAGGFHSAKLIIPNFETGSILAIPAKKRFTYDCLGLTLVLLQALYDLKVHSAYFRHISVKNDFSVRFYDAIANGLPGKIHETKIGWKALQKHFNRNPGSFDRFEQPFLQYEDVELKHPVDALVKTLPGLGFWTINSHVFLKTEPHSRPVSFHLMDVILNASNNLPYENSSYAHLRSSLWEELGLLYLKELPIMTLVFSDLDEKE